jgi:hypothetical protein
MVAAGRWCEPGRSSIAAGERPKLAGNRGSQSAARPSRPDWKRAKKRLSPAYLQRRRQAIAELVEKSAGFDGNSSSKLTDARLAGPKVLIHREWKNWLKPTTEVDVIYCAKAQLDSSLFPPRTALIFVRNDGNGAETLQAIVERNSYGAGVEPPGCHRMEGYEPFPDLEQARARKRQALGKTD